ncbi:MAG: hypothetical protein ABSH20_03750 [Tepidisphaeraceae bacterium]|jgi:hypothetical protein
MSIIPVSSLSSSDLRVLGNNLARPKKLRPGCNQRRRQQMIVAAVNRSLSSVGEQIDRLHRPLTQA